MIALISRWKLKHGFPDSLAAQVEEMVNTVRREEPGTLVFAASLPGAPPPIGPPPTYSVHPDLAEAPPAPTHLVFLEVYRDDQAFSAHLQGSFLKFMDACMDSFSTPWQGRPRPDVTFLDVRTVMSREFAPEFKGETV